MTLFAQMALIVGAAVALGTLLSVLVKFTIESNFKGLVKQVEMQQLQIEGLLASGRLREKEIVQLRGMVDDWQKRFFDQQSEHTRTKMQYEQLQSEFNKSHQ